MSSCKICCPLVLQSLTILFDRTFKHIHDINTILLFDRTIPNNYIQSWPPPIGSSTVISVRLVHKQQPAMFVASRLIQRIQFSRAFPTQACFAVQFSKALHSASSSGELLSQHFKLIEDVITEEEEEELLNYLNPMLDRKRYEGNHWDSVITLYKEMELHSVSSRGIKQPDRAKEILGRVAELATQHYKHDIKLPLLPPHAIDLHEVSLEEL